MATAEPESGTDPAARTFSFIDMAGFTAMTEAMSDDDAADVVARFCEIAREALGSDDRLVKSIGDAVMLVSPTPTAGLQLVTRTLDLVAAETSFPLPRAGLHHGPAAERDGDYFGAASTWLREWPARRMVARCWRRSPRRTPHACRTCAWSTSAASGSAT